MEVFTKVLEPLVEVSMPKPNTEHVHSFDIDSFVKKHSRRLLDYEQVVHLINIMHSFSSFYNMLHTFLSLYL
jgi:hypothetical protein